jgi:signal transduction histidine kinase/CheY-like chemotaxis protein
MYGNLMNPGRLDILLVEDNPGDARLVRELLTDFGRDSHRLQLADRLSVGLDQLARGAADVVLLDLGLPDSEGLNTVQRVHNDHPELPVIVLSGLADEDLAIAAVQAGAQDYLVKGRFDSELLRRSIQHAIERKRIEVRQHLLVEAGAVLASSLDYETTLHHVAELAVSALAETCVVDVLLDDGTLKRLAMMPPRALPVDHADHVEVVLRSGRAEMSESRMSVPLVAHGRTLGVITLVRADERRAYGPADWALAEELARRAALAIEHARLYMEAEHSIQVRDSIPGTVSHDLRNPLTAVHGYAGMLRLRLQRADEPPPDWLLHGLERIIAMCTAMSRGIGDLVDTATLQSGRLLSLHLERVDLVELVRQLIVDVQPTTSEHRIEFEADADHLYGMWDRPRLEQVLGNLLGNAIKYSPNGGVIRVSVAHEPGHEVTLTVSDEGIGIPKADRGRLFSPFFRASNVIGAFPGTGIGLAGARQILEELGGSIDADTVQDIRTTIVVRLPLSTRVVYRT